jgi:ADP-ribose pyrophosphatase YjhB (NUDIX family)
MRWTEPHGVPRPVCPDCGWIQFRNPVVGVAAVIDEEAVTALLDAASVHAAMDRAPVPGERRVLVARRAASHRGLFCLPCGYVEFDEEIREALVRETEEETGLAVTPGEIVAVHSNFHDPDRQSVGIWFRAIPVGGTLRPGDDVDKLLFVPPGAPGVPLAFPTDAEVLASLARDGGSPRQTS